MLLELASRIWRSLTNDRTSKPMGLLADYQALPADQIKLATLNGDVATAQAALDAAQAAVAAEQTQIAADTATVVADLQAAPYNGSAVIVDTSQAPLVTVSLLTVTATTPPGLASQSVNVAQ